MTPAPFRFAVAQLGETFEHFALSALNVSTHRRRCLSGVGSGERVSKAGVKIRAQSAAINSRVK